MRKAWVTLAALGLASSSALAGNLTECGAEVRTITVKMYSTPLAIRQAYQELTHIRPQGLKGFATYNNRTEVHTLHVLLIAGIKSGRQIQTLGHELLHALCGDWHPEVQD